MMELKIEMKDLLRDMKEYTDRFEYLAFFQHLVEKTSLVLARMVDDAYIEEYRAEVPKVPHESKAN